MPLITISDLSLRFRGPSLLDQVSCQIEAGQRIGLLGRNGSGKTTLMGILCGAVEPDSGTTTMAPQTRLSMLPQDVPDEIFGAITRSLRWNPRDDLLPVVQTGHVQCPTKATQGTFKRDPRDAQT